jgi:hypothetical protein
MLNFRVHHCVLLNLVITLHPGLIRHSAFVTCDNCPGYKTTADFKVETGYKKTGAGFVPSVFCRKRK